MKYIKIFLVSVIILVGYVGFSQAATILFPSGGGTGTSTTPTYGKMLVGNASGTYTLTATSSLGISSSPAGLNTYVQYNNGGSFGGDSNLTWDKNNQILLAPIIAANEILGASSDVLLVPGASGAFVKLNDSISGKNAILNTNLIASTDKIFSFPNVNGTFCLNTTTACGNASSTNYATILGIGAGGTNATTSATIASTTAVGYNALNSLTSGVNNTAFGVSALSLEKTGQGNAAFGNGALQNYTASWNTAFGSNALESNTTGQFNTAVGDAALFADLSGGFNTAVGEEALNANINGNTNTAVGNDSMLFFKSGSWNTAVGGYALRSLAGGNRNTSIGEEALFGLGATASSSDNTVMGFAAAFDGSGGAMSSSTVIGSLAGFALNTGSKNTFIGTEAGSTTATGQGNIVIGYDIPTPVVNGNNQLNIGNLIFGTGMNGEGATLAGNVGIGTTTPSSLLAIHAINGSTNTTLFSIGSSTAATTTTLFGITNSGHIFGTSTTPVLSSCGTAPSLVGGDAHGTITVGSVATACTLTFGTPYTTKPSCTVTNQSMSVVNAMTYTESVTALTISQTGLSGDLLDYHCFQN